MLQILYFPLNAQLSLLTISSSQYILYVFISPNEELGDIMVLACVPR